MAPPSGPYSGTSTLALVARVSAFSIGLVYGSMKLKYLKEIHWPGIGHLSLMHPGGAIGKWLPPFGCSIRHRGDAYVGVRCSNI
ncbi:hypothetical protein Acr_07g0000830 [Actinidia rufa]|uniref:Uncharacterized protein n=1 Tax=Actinidia rufa TaxID=165716 RepID=A0A7J0EUI5_9ERIC|nr:hypothetical protein Acr_07g0000830 [Actinidia rufa]